MLAPRVFVIRNSGIHICCNPVCPNHRNTDSQDLPIIIALEPILDPGTLTSAAELNLFHGCLLLFQRDDTKYASKGYHLGSVITSKAHTMFCVDCLQLLWDQRVRAWIWKDRASRVKAICASAQPSPISCTGHPEIRSYYLGSESFYSEPGGEWQVTPSYNRLAVASKPVEEVKRQDSTCMEEGN
jgi:hypothetical protein